MMKDKIGRIHYNIYMITMVIMVMFVMMMMLMMTGIGIAYA